MTTIRVVSAWAAGASSSAAKTDDAAINLGVHLAKARKKAMRISIPMFLPRYERVN
jgi:hypothetical protein